LIDPQNRVAYIIENLHNLTLSVRHENIDVTSFGDNDSVFIEGPRVVELQTVGSQIRHVQLWQGWQPSGVPVQATPEEVKALVRRFNLTGR